MLNMPLLHGLGPRRDPHDLRGLCQGLGVPQLRGGEGVNSYHFVGANRRKEGKDERILQTRNDAQARL